MSVLPRIAARNLWRNRRRTLITGSAIAIGLGMMIWANNINHGMHGAMIRTGVSQMAGHVVVQAQGYQDDREQDQTVTDAVGVQSELDSAFPDAVVTRRAFLGGLLNSPTNSVAAGITAVDPQREPRVSDWQDKISDGSYLDDDPRSIVLGWKLAESLEVELGDKVVFMTQGPDEVESQLFRVRGLLRTGSDDVDGFFALVSIDAAGTLLGGDLAHQVSLHLDDPGMTNEVAVRTTQVLEQRDLDVLPWQEAIPDIYELVVMDDQMNHVFLGVLGLMVAIGLLNTVLMSVMERIREFGVMLAIGVSRKRLSRLILLEGLILGAFSVAVGFAVGVLLTYPAKKYGLDYTQFGMGEQIDMQGVSISGIIYAEYNWPSAILYIFAGLLLTVLATVYPAYRAGKLKPVDAMRHV